MTELPIENVQDYPRPPALERVSLRLKAVLQDTVVAETERSYRVLETHHAPTYYFPPEDVFATLTAADGRSFCEWKGVASYWNVDVNGATAPRAAWSYARPTPAFREIEGYLAIYATSMDACFVGDSRVIPQPGNFYGGWVTENLRGQIKGAPGTEHW
ncbi:MAG: DUF427 domain-containing protein [Pseudomonadota bacterium]